MSHAERCIEYILERTPTPGVAWSPDLHAHAFLVLIGRQIASSTDTWLFGMRQKEHVGYAVEQVGANGILSPPAALASFFLATRLEYYFRRLGTSLGPDGAWLSADAQTRAQAEIPDERLRARRVSDVALAYRLMLLNRGSPCVQHFARLEKLLAEHNRQNGTHDEADIGARIALLRHPASHGFFDDASSEGLFYALLVSLIYCTHDA